MDARELPPTRRALHRAPAGGRRRGALPAVPRAASSLPGPARHSDHPVRTIRRVSQQAVAAATAMAFVAGGVSAVGLDTVERQALVAHEAAQEQQIRVDRAATLRLTAAASRYAHVREEHALTAAQAALERADAVLVHATSMVGEATVDPLSKAAAELAAMLASAAPAASETVTTPVVDAVPDLVSDIVVPDAVLPDTVLPDTVPDAAATAGAAAEISTGTATAAGPGAGAAATPQDAIAPPGPAAPLAASADRPARALGAPPEVLDLELSARLLEVAEQVAALSAQVQLLADDIAAELAAAETAAAARRAEEEDKRRAAETAALQAALRRLSTRIAATDAAPNGQIPIELLCRPRFASVLLRCDAAQALDRLNDEYRAAFGRNLAVSGGYRTLAEQELARATKGDLAALPGTSNHGRALAVDFSDFGALGRFDDPDYLWMVEHAGRFGWVHPAGMGPGGPGPHEPWHWEFGTL